MPLESVYLNGGFIGTTTSYQLAQAGSALTITEVGTATTSYQSGGTLSLPSGLQEGDVVIVCGSEDDSFTITAPSGWTLVLNGTEASTPHTIFYKVMGATPDTSVTLQSGNAAWVCFAMRGVDTSVIFDVTTTKAYLDADADPDPPSITTVTNGCMIIAFGFLDDQNSSVIVPSGYTSIGNQTGDGTTMVAKKLQTTAGTENPGIFSTSNDRWVAATMALRPGTTAPVASNDGIFNLQAVLESLSV